MQKHLQDEIIEKLENAKMKVIQHFDEEVRQKLKLRNENVVDALSRYDQQIKTYAFCLMGNALKEISDNRFEINIKKWKGAPKVPNKYFHATYGIGNVPIEEQDAGVIPFSTRAEVLKAVLQKDKSRTGLSGNVTLKPISERGKRTVDQIGGKKGHIVVHRLKCKHQSVIGDDHQEEFEIFVYSGIVQTDDGWKLLKNQKAMEQLLDPTLMEWESTKEATFRLRDDLGDQVPRDIEQTKQSVIDKNEEFVDRQRAMLQQYAKDSLMKTKKRLEVKQEEIDTLERQLKVSRTMGAHERREVRDEVDKKMKEYRKIRTELLRAEDEAFAMQEDELITLKSKLELKIDEEKLLTLHFSIV